MKVTHDWSGFHDATLEAIEIRWASGEAVLRVRTGSSPESHRVIVASSMRRIVCNRQLPWGISGSINEIRGPDVVGDRISAIEIEMQSGDLIRVEATDFSLSAPG